MMHAFPNASPPGPSSPETCVLISRQEDEAEGGGDGYVVGSVNKFLLISRDRYGNRLLRGGDNYHVLLHDAGKSIQLDGFATDNNDGSYAVAYFPTRVPQPSSDYTVSIYMQSDAEGATAREDEMAPEGFVHITGSPFTIHPLDHEANKRAQAQQTVKVTLPI